MRNGLGFYNRSLWFYKLRLQGEASAAGGTLGIGLYAALFRTARAANVTGLRR